MFMVLGLPLDDFRNSFSSIVPATPKAHKRQAPVLRQVDKHHIRYRLPGNQPDCPYIV